MENNSKTTFKQMIAKHRSKLGLVLVIGFTAANAVALFAVFATIAGSR
jgi:hypothetical protein